MKPYRHLPIILLAIGLILIGIRIFFPHSSKPTTTLPTRAPYAGCTWGEQTGAGLHLWTQLCNFDGRSIRIAPSETLPGYFEETKDGTGDWTASKMAIQVFTVAPGETINDLLPAVTTQYSTFPKGATCAFERSDMQSSPGKSRYLLSPTGKTKDAYAIAVKNTSEVPAPPCGEFGINADATSYFEFQNAHPNTILYVNIGQEAPLFDETQIGILPK